MFWRILALREKHREVADAIVKESRLKKPIAVKCNVASKEEVQNVVDICVEKFGKVDIIVNNAGITLPACPIEDISPEQWKRVLDIDLMGTIYGTQCVIPIMRNEWRRKKLSTWHPLQDR